MKKQLMHTTLLSGLLGVGWTNAALVHQYTFNDDTANDSVGAAHGTVEGLVGVYSTISGHRVLDLSANLNNSNSVGFDSFVNLPNGIISGAAGSGVSGELTLEFWVQASTNVNWAAFGSFGNNPGGEDASAGGGASSYIQVIPQEGTPANAPLAVLRATTKQANVAGEGFVDAANPLSTTNEQHVVTVFDGTNINLYVDGAFVGSELLPVGFDLTTLNDNNNWLGRSQWDDPLFRGHINEFSVHNNALSAGEVAAEFSAGAVVPEPSSSLLLGLGGLALILRRKK